MNLIFSHIATRLSKHFNQPVEIINQQQVFGGDINQTFQLKTNIGSFFLKLNNGSLNDMFEKEFNGLYDPAVYYGSREMDIAMSLLFGGFDKSFYRFYDEVFPLQPGWQQRIELCQLYPLLVHLILFGGHYYYSVMGILKKYF